MNDVQQTLMQLRNRGWTLAAIGRELNIPANTLRKWSAGLRYPANSSAVKASLLALSLRQGSGQAQRPAGPKAGSRPVRPEGAEQLSAEVRAGLGLFRDLAPDRSTVDELIQERRQEAARD
jgi:hypothetical protein